MSILPEACDDGNKQIEDGCDSICKMSQAILAQVLLLQHVPVTVLLFSFGIRLQFNVNLAQFKTVLSASIMVSVLLVREDMSFRLEVFHA